MQSLLDGNGEIGAAQLTQHALRAVLGPDHLDLATFHLEHLGRTVGYTDLAALAPFKIDLDDRGLFSSRLLLGQLQPLLTL